MTNVLMISTDAKILEEGSPVRARMEEYGNLFGELHIVVFSKKGALDARNAAGADEGKIKISRNTFAYPTNSSSKLFYVNDAVRIGASVIAAGLTAENSVITAQDPFETGIVGKKLSEKTGLPLHIQIHTDFHSPYFKKSILNRVRIALSKKTLPHARAVRAVSERIKASLSADIAAKTSVLPIFADVEAIKAAPIRADLRAKYPQFKKIVLIASRLTKEKGIRDAIDAFAGTAASYPDAGLVILGSGPEETSLKSKVRALGLDGKVAFESWAD
ncbi:glycosyltransferase, partial [Candidatus Parcubacteria bacterium]|nr:glycosyltransferase [Candidatus Parcubacteria bacterium]